MATLDPKKGVPGIPLGALDAISDENTRQVLRAMVDGWHVRNGSSGTGESAFVTKGEMSGLKTTGWFSGNNQAPDASKTQIKPGDINRIINDLQAQVMESLLFKELGERINLIQVDGSKNAADISSEVTKRLNGDNAIVNSTNTQFTVINGNVAAVQNQTNTLSNNVSAVTQQISTLQSQVGSNLSALQLEASTRANADGDLYAKYSVKIDQNGYVSGFGLMSTANNSTPFSEFIVRADRFAIGSPSGPGVAARVPFIVTTGYDGNGNPPGVYMDMAVMRNASIKRALIGDAEVDTLKIAGNAVTVPRVDFRPWGVSGGSGNVIVADIWLTLDQPGWVYAMFTANQTYGSGIRDSHTYLNLAGQGVAVGGLAVTTNIAVSSARYLPAGGHSVQVSWTGQDSGVRIDNTNLFVMGVMR